MKPYFSISQLLLLLAFVCGVGNLVLAQTVGPQLSSERIEEIRKHAKHIPLWVKKKPEPMVQYLTGPYSDDASKAMAISCWISSNIRYDYKAYLNRSLDYSTTFRVIRSRKALCGGYANVFKEMCALAGLDADVVPGYTRDFDFFDGDTLYRTEHAWSIVKTDGEWRLADLTYGAGRIKERKQYIKRFLWNTFRWEYEHKFKWVKEFDPVWFDVDPRALVFTHFPVLEAHQLLATPLDLRYYEQGVAAIYTHVTEAPEIDRNNPGIQSYHSLEDLDRWKFMANTSATENDHLHPGFYELLIADSLFRAVIFDDPHGYKLTDGQLNEMLHIATSADSLFGLAMVDNDAEYQSRMTRSKVWKAQVQSGNKYNRKLLKARIKENRKQLQTLTRIKSKNRFAGRYAKTSTRRFRSSPIKYTRRPNPASADSLQSLLLLQRADSMAQETAGFRAVIDSLCSPFSLSANKQSVETEQVIRDQHAENTKVLRRRILSERHNLPMIYRDSTELRKPWFSAQQAMVDSANRQSTGKLLYPLYEAHLAGIAAVKKRLNETRQHLRLIQGAKRKSIRDRGEDELYRTVVETVKEDLQYGSQKLDQLDQEIGSLTPLLKAESASMRKANRLLLKDSRWESIRHGSYKRYRKRFRKAEKGRIKGLKRRAGKVISFARGVLAKRARMEEMQAVDK